MTEPAEVNGGCPFCAISEGIAPSREVWRSDKVLAFLPDVPAVEGHTLVIPRRHVRDIWDMDATTARLLLEATVMVAAAVAKAIGTRHMNIIQSSGEAAGQTVFHLHVHIVPRLPGDRMPELWPGDADWSPATLDAVAADIRGAVGQLGEHPNHGYPEF